MSEPSQRLAAHAAKWAPVSNPINDPIWPGWTGFGLDCDWRLATGDCDWLTDWVNLWPWMVWIASGQFSKLSSGEKQGFKGNTIGIELGTGTQVRQGANELAYNR